MPGGGKEQRPTHIQTVIFFLPSCPSTPPERHLPSSLKGLLLHCLLSFLFTGVMRVPLFYNPQSSFENKEKIIHCGGERLLVVTQYTQKKRIFVCPNQNTFCNFAPQGDIYCGRKQQHFWHFLAFLNLFLKKKLTRSFSDVD